MANQVVENLKANGMSAEDFVVSTDRLLFANANFDNEGPRVEEIEERVMRLTGAGIEATRDFLMFRASIGLDRAVRQMGIED